MSTTTTRYRITVIEETRYAGRGMRSVWFRAEIHDGERLAHITGRHNTRSAAQSDGAAWVLDREGAV